MCMNDITSNIGKSRKSCGDCEMRCEELVESLDPEVLQSGFGVISFILAWRFLGKVPCEFLSEF